MSVHAGANNWYMPIIGDHIHRQCAQKFDDHMQMYHLSTKITVNTFTMYVTADFTVWGSIRSLLAEYYHITVFTFKYIATNV